MLKRKHKKFLSKKAFDKRKQRILQKNSEGLSCREICEALNLKEHIVAYALKDKNALELVSKTNQALEKANENPVAAKLRELVDLLNISTPELGEVAKAVVFPKTRKVRLTLKRELELTV